MYREPNTDRFMESGAHHLAGGNPILTEAKSSRDWRGILEDLNAEHGFVPMRVEGQIPEDLEGTFLRNGPANQGNFGQDYAHWFDGDGAVTGVRLAEGKAYGAIKIVQTPEYLEEQSAGKLIYPGFGTKVSGFLKRTKIKNVANTNLMQWQDRLFALWEGGLPTEISSTELDTIGRTDVEQTIRGSFSAHHHRVHARRAQYNFGMNVGLKPSLDLYEFPDAGPARHLARIGMLANTMLHDFIVTNRYAIFLVSPIRLQNLRFILGRGTLAENFTWCPELGTEVICIPLDSPDNVTRYQIEPFYQWHFANAFDRKDEVIIDFVRFEDFELVGWRADLESDTRGLTAFGELGRARLNPSAKSFSYEPLAEHSVEFPSVNPSVTGAEHRYIYLTKHSKQALQERTLFDEIAKVDVATGSWSVFPLEGETVGSEPVFAPRPSPKSEDDGYLLSLVYDPQTHTSHVLILDATSLERGPLARIHFDHHIPYTFHGIWVP